MLGDFSTSICIPQDLSAEAKALIFKHKQPSFQNTILFQDVGKDLANYIDRPELIAEVFTQIPIVTAYFNVPIVILSFAETLKDNQIQKLANNYIGNQILYKMAEYLTNIPTGNITKSVNEKDKVTGNLIIIHSKNEIEWNRCIRLSMKIKMYLQPIVSQSSKPFVGDIVPNNTGISDRFGSDHDGVHIRAPKEGGNVITIKGLEGIVIRYYNQDNTKTTLYGVWVLLKDDKVIVYKDLGSVDRKIRSVLEYRKIYYNFALNKLTSKFFISVGELIGTINPWTKSDSANNFNSEDNGLHLTIYKDVKDLKSYSDYLRVPDGDKKAAHPLDKFVSPCSLESPVRCF